MRQFADPVNRKSFRQWLVHLPKPCAVFAENDWDAADVINSALLNDIDIPSELSVLGVGNDICVCHAPSVSLSSIDSRLYQLGWVRGGRT